MPGRSSNSPWALAPSIFSTLGFSNCVVMRLVYSTTSMCYIGRVSAGPKARPFEISNFKFEISNSRSPKTQADKFLQVLRNISGRCDRKNGHSFQGDPFPHRSVRSWLYHRGSIRAVEVRSRTPFEIRDVEVKNDDVEIRRDKLEDTVAFHNHELLGLKDRLV